MTEKLEQLLKGALLAIEDATIVSDLDGNISYISQQASKLLGLEEGFTLPLSTPVVLNFYEFNNGDQVKKKEYPLEEVIAKGDFSNLLLQTDSEKGDSRIISFSGKKIRSADQEIIGTILKLNDLSLRLKGPGNGRFPKANEPDYLSEYASNASDMELEAFIYSVSHDLQAPLRHIQGFSELLNEECSAELSEEGISYIARLQTACTNIQHQLVNLLQLSRNTRGRMFRSVVNLSEIAREILDGFKRKALDREVSILVEPNLEVVGDQRLLIVLMQQLLENAWKFSSEREKSCIEFGMKEITGKNTFYIYDNGLGIDNRRADKLFLPFKKLHGERFPGKGIGLATCLRIINRHGGKIWFESEPKQGTTFFFTIE